MSGERPYTTSDLSIYWYGKSDVRKGRKMGHITGSAKTMEEFQKVLEEMTKLEQNWVRSIRYEK
jgi:phosphoribosylaminoimidazole carboxylase (NCAIR synthetase)